MNTSHSEQRVGKAMLLIGWLVGLALLTMFFNGWQERRANPNANPTSTNAEGLRSVVLQRNYLHHYMAGGQINGEPVTFLVDTGATTVSVPAHLAERLQLAKGAPMIAQTANGLVQTHATVINELKLGDITLHKVQASINPGMQQDEILLGMSALKNVEFTHRDGTLTLNQYY